MIKSIRINQVTLFMLTQNAFIKIKIVFRNITEFENIYLRNKLTNFNKLHDHKCIKYIKFKILDIFNLIYV